MEYFDNALDPIEYFDNALDPAMIISKQLTRSDIVGNMTLPTQQVMSVLTKWNGTTWNDLQTGVQVQVFDLLENDRYQVTLRWVDDNSRFYFGTGWSIMKHSLELEEGKPFKLYWDHLHNTFVVLNHEYKLIQDSDSGQS
ncbi:unnamed protein product [Arabis nemorensis]|uniref:TF-B3 domain-containing protein n=1 Tax=Arabis nemorensis TaxID=586526 RepID=A0A565BIL1_9BRAS|nr:unnamed protein product [Arabis nemorensis]